MPSDSEIRDRFHEGTQPKGQIDVDAVLRRARARRRPKVALAGAGSVLAIAAIAVPAVYSSYTSGAGGDSAFVAADEAAAPESGGAGDSDGGGATDQMMSKQADLLNRCMAPVAEIVPAESGMVITVEPVTAPASADSIPVTVTLTNGGDQSILGTTGGRPSLTLSQDGVTIWHTNGPQDMMARIVDLGPGESMTYETSFEPLVCGAGDDDLEAFPADLPEAGAGVYRLSAAIDVVHDDGSAMDLVTGPESDVRLN